MTNEPAAVTYGTWVFSSSVSIKFGSIISWCKIKSSELFFPNLTENFISYLCFFRASNVIDDLFQGALPKTGPSNPDKANTIVFTLHRALILKLYFQSIVTSIPPNSVFSDILILVILG